MADAALFLGWGEVIAGREAIALAGFNESMAFYTAQQQNGTIESFEPVILWPHGGDLGGFILIRGEAAKLAALKQTAEFQRLNTRAQLFLHGLGVIDGYIGASLATMMATWGQASQELA